MPIKLTALINDTTGTLIASNYVDPDTKIAVIFGTGCNAAYMETAGNIPKMKHLGLPDDQEMAINVSLPVGRACVAVLIVPGDSVNGERSIRLTTNTFVSAVCKSVSWSYLQSSNSARTKYDIIIDESSNKPGEQSFEKMIAGLYLGEVFRLVLVEMIDAGELFLGQNTYKMEKAYAMDTAFLSLMERSVPFFLLFVGLCR